MTSFTPDGLTLEQLIAVDPTNLSVDELAVLKRTIKDQAYAAIRTANEIQDVKIFDAHVEEARKQIAIAAAEEGVTEEQVARRWLRENYADPGRNVQARLYLDLPRIADVPDWAQAVQLAPWWRDAGRPTGRGQRRWFRDQGVPGDDSIIEQEEAAAEAMRQLRIERGLEVAE